MVKGCDKQARHVPFNLHDKHWCPGYEGTAQGLDSKEVRSPLLLWCRWWLVSPSMHSSSCMATYACKLDKTWATPTLAQHQWRGGSLREWDTSVGALLLPPSSFSLLPYFPHLFLWSSLSSPRPFHSCTREETVGDAARSQGLVQLFEWLCRSPAHSQWGQHIPAAKSCDDDQVGCSESTCMCVCSHIIIAL